MNDAEPAVAPKVSAHSPIDKKKVFVFIVIFLILTGVFVIYSAKNAASVASKNTSTEDESTAKSGRLFDAPSRDEFDAIVQRKTRGESEQARKPKPKSAEAIKERNRERLLKKARPEKKEKPKPKRSQREVKTPEIAKTDPFEAAYQKALLEETVAGLTAHRNPTTISGFPVATQPISEGHGGTQSVSSNLAVRSNGSTELKFEQEIQNLRDRASAIGSQANGLDPLTGLQPQPTAFAATPSLSEKDRNLLTGGVDMPAFPSGYAGSNETFFTEPPAGSVVVPAGTVISLVVQSHLNSDNPGQALARIENDVYDSKRRAIVIPAGSRVLAQAFALKTGKNQAINERLGVVAQTIIRPDHLKIDLSDQSLLDGKGHVGITGDVNHHILAKTLATIGYFAASYVPTNYVYSSLARRDSRSSTSTGQPQAPAANDPSQSGDCKTEDKAESSDSIDEESSETTDALDCLPSVIVNTTIDNANSNENPVQSAQGEITREFAAGLLDAYQPIFEKYFDLEPTITVRPGERMKLIITTDIYAKPTERVYAKFIQ